MDVRVGFGYDVHPFKKGRKLWLGGIEIPYEKGLLGHSDADVVIHAIADALLGAASLRDIGFHFPDTAKETKDIDSKILLSKVMELLSQKRYIFGNVDVTICAEKPKISPYIEAMRKSLAQVIATKEDNISIKATTQEKLGFVGREEGISAYAVVLIKKEI